MFPEEYTRFLDKRNARYDGDPEGDVILAEHVNVLQDAISALERTIGRQPKPTDTLTDRIVALEALRPMRVPALHWYKGALPADTGRARDAIQRFEGFILSERSANLGQILADYPHPVYGVLNAQTPLAVLQTEAAEWRDAGARGILLLDFQLVPTRTQEQRILDSLKERGIAPLLKTDQPARLFQAGVQSGYNSDGKALAFPSGTALLLSPFAHSGRTYTTSELMAQTYPLVQQARANGLSLIGMGQSKDQESYHYLQAAGLLFGLDGLVDAPDGGSDWGQEPPVYAWHAPLVDWRTDKPAVYQEGSRLTRTVPGGLIGLADPGEVILKGHTLDATLIDWVANTVPGSALAEGSLDPSKLSGYDVKKIVELLNTSGDDIQIDLSKINMSEDGGLPANIPAENMITNVIEAVNRKANPLSTNKSQIENAAIESLDAAKLSGDIARERFEKFVIPAINATDSASNYLDVLRLDAVNLNSTGTIAANSVTADALDARQVNVQEALTTVDLTTSGYHTGHEGEYERLIVDWLTAYKLDGLKELHVETLTADNMSTLVLDAIDAHIVNGRFNTIVTQALTAETIQADLVTALNSITGSQITNSALFGEAVIDSAAIKSLDVAKLRSGTINTSLINLSSEEGHLKLEDNTLQVYDSLDEENNRRLRVLLGSTKDITDEETFGLVVLGEDGQTRLYDHTGVYSAGLHQNVISNDKIQDDAVDGRVIRAGAIFTDHLDADTVTAEKIATDAILARHILAEEITGEKIAGTTITGAHIKSGTIDTGHLAAGSITAEKLKARSITADKLTVGFTANQVKDGYDSFEQEPLGVFAGLALSGSATGRITRDWSWDGRNSFALMGNSPSNRVALMKSALDYTIPVQPDTTLFVSVSVKTDSENDVPVSLGLAFNKGERLYSPLQTVTKSDRVKRLWASFTAPADSLRAAVILGVETTNTEVFFDCLQVETAEPGQTEPGFWKATATTKIDGASIETGYVDAQHIHIGSGTVFGASNDIIDITDTGITAKSTSGSASLNSKGLEIKGGAFVLEGGISGNTIKIDGERGIDVENSQSLIQMNGENGFRIVSKARNQVVMDIEPETGDIRFSGKARFYSADNPLMNWTIEDKMAQIDVSIKDNSESIIEANESAKQAIENISELEEKTSYRVDLTSTKGLLFKKGTIQTEIFATVYRNNEDITHELPNSAFIWRKTKADGSLDTVWESSKSDVGPRISVNNDEVLGGATFSCAISI